MYRGAISSFRHVPNFRMGLYSQRDVVRMGILLLIHYSNSMAYGPTVVMPTAKVRATSEDCFGDLSTILRYRASSGYGGSTTYYREGTSLSCFLFVRPRSPPFPRLLPTLRFLLRILHGHPQLLACLGCYLGCYLVCLGHSSRRLRLFYAPHLTVRYGRGLSIHLQSREFPCLHSSLQIWRGTSPTYRCLLLPVRVSSLGLHLRYDRTSTASYLLPIGCLSQCERTIQTSVRPLCPV